MDAGGMEKDCSALGGLFHTIMTDMKGGYPVWEDFISKTTKLQSHLRSTIVIAGAFLDAFQKVADLAMNTRGATKEIGSALTRMCMRHRSIESRLKQLTIVLTDGLINPLELRIEEWKKIANQLDKDHAKEYKKARQEIKKKSSDTLKLQKKVKKGKEDARLQLDSMLQDVNEKYALLEDTEKQAVCRALIEERSRFCSFVSLLRPVLGEEIGMLGEVTHLQTILDDLSTLTAEPHTLPPASEQVIADLKVTDDYNYTYHTPPSSPSTTLSRRGTLTSSSQCLPAAGRHAGIPSFDPVPATLDTLLPQPPAISIGLVGQDRCALPPPDRAHTNTGQKQESAYPSMGTHATHTRLEAGDTLYPDRPRAMTTTAACKPALGEMSAREHLALALSHGPSGEAPGSSRDSLHCSSGYSTQTTTPSCSEDTIPSHSVKKDHELIDYDCVSLHGERELADHITFDKSSTIPRNSDLGQNYRRMFQEKRPASTVSLLTEPEARFPSHVATIRRKPSSKPGLRRGTISGVPIPIRPPVVPIPIRPPVVPMPPPPVSGKPAGLLGACTTSEEWVGTARKQGTNGSILSYPSPYPLPCPTAPSPTYPQPCHSDPSPYPQSHPADPSPTYPQSHPSASSPTYPQSHSSAPNPYPQSHSSAPSPYPQSHPSVPCPYPQSHPSVPCPYPQSHPSAPSPCSQPCGLHQSPHNLSYTQPSVGIGLSVQPPPAAIVQGGGSSSVTVTAPSPSNTSDVLSLIRRGVKLRKTFTNDRSAPKIM